MQTATANYEIIVIYKFNQLNLLFFLKIPLQGFIAFDFVGAVVDALIAPSI